MNQRVLSVLLVEDHHGDIQLVQEHLRDIKDADIRMTVVSDLNELAPILKITATDVILLDLGLPGCSGLETLVRLRAMAPGLPVIVLTGHDDGQLAERVIQKGAQDFVAKDELGKVRLERIIRNAVERHRIHTALQARLENHTIDQNFQNLIVQNMSEGVLVVDSEGIIEYANPAAGTLLNGQADRLIGAEFGFPISDECLIEVPPHMGSSETKYLEMHVVEPTNMPSLMRVVSLQDVSHHERTRAQLMHTAHHDSLTGVEVRRMFDKRLSRLIEKARRKQIETFVVMYVDCDNFKQVNDEYGHSIGDAVLQGIAEVLLNAVRPSDFIGRLGGDEFALGLEDINSISDAIGVADRIIAAVGDSIQVGNKQISTSVSIGLASYRQGHREPRDILRDADTALQFAKKRGKARYEVFDDGMSADQTLSEYFGTELTAALNSNQLDAMLQPIISAHNRAVVSFEAFLRWYRPNGTILYPSNFMDTVRSKGLSREIDSWVIERTGEIYRRDRILHQQIPAIGLHLNICAATLGNSEFLAWLTDSKEKTSQVRPLTFEVSEKDAEMMNLRKPEVWDLLYQNGINIHIDRFGTGSAPLALMQLPVVKEISIAPRLVKSILVDKASRQIVQSIIHAAHDLDKLVVAEGIENPEQFNYLSNVGCDLLQGHLISKPLDQSVIIDFLRDGNPWFKGESKRNDVKWPARSDSDYKKQQSCLIPAESDD
ncbi:MAG TPA: EAL domain-containing protein [candidate division Zixibacteria bacterium]|nr:EAL domain-containing protein [candidate division Zixibacteria bacterium]